MKEGSQKISTKKITLCGIMTAFAMVLSYIEHILPFSVGLYGIKLGLANLAIVICLYLLGEKYAIITNFVRIILTFLLFGNFMSLAYSLFGGMISTIIMTLLKSSKKVSCIGVSICGGVVHNFVQLCVAAVMISTIKIGFYFPVLLISGTVAGFIIGVVSLAIINNKYIQKIAL